MSKFKQDGKTLTSVRQGVLEAIPLRFRNAMKFTEEYIPVPLDTEHVPTMLNGVVLSELNQTRTNERDSKVIVGTPPENPLLGKEIQDDGQIGSVTEQIIVTGGPEDNLTADELTAGGEITNLGNGFSVKRVTKVPAVFDHKIYETSVMEVLPPMFRGTLKTYTESEIVAGTAGPVTLTAGQIRKSEEQLTKFTKRVSWTSLEDPSEYPYTFTGWEFNSSVGALVKVQYTLNDTATGLPSAYKNQFLVGFEERPLGNGLFHSEIKTRDSAWPIYYSGEVDTRTGSKILHAKTYIANSNTSVNYNGAGVTVEVQPYDEVKSIQITTTVTLPSNNHRIFNCFHNFPLPDILKSAQLVSQIATSGDGRGAVDVGLNVDIESTPKGPFKAELHEFYTFDPASVSIPAPTIFRPQGHMISLRVALSGSNQAYARVHTFTIPPTLHQEITLASNPGIIGGTLQATSPTALPGTGSKICVAAPPPERSRFGVFIVSYLTIEIP